MFHPLEVERFWTLVGLPDKNGCRYWLGHRNKDGYGLFYNNTNKVLSAHKTSYLIANGPLPAGKPLVCHSCDAPLCIEPSHLFAGSNSDNMKDMYAKGRNNPKTLLNIARHGEAHGRTTLTQKDVDRIRQLLSKPVPRGFQKHLATQYGVSTSVISSIKQGRSWKCS